MKCPLLFAHLISLSILGFVIDACTTATEGSSTIQIHSSALPPPPTQTTRPAMTAKPARPTPSPLPLYTLPPLASPYPEIWIFPDADIVYSPTALDFDTAAYVQHAHGFLAEHEEYLVSTGWTPAADIIQRVALENSINPRLLLALLEYQSQCVLGHPPGI
ncbi:MAG: hypothetical protein R6U51_03950 [Anaerolineales bacterium]